MGKKKNRSAPRENGQPVKVFEKIKMTLWAVVACMIYSACFVAACRWNMILFVVVVFVFLVVLCASRRRRNLSVLGEQEASEGVRFVPVFFVPVDMVVSSCTIWFLVGEFFFSERTWLGGLLCPLRKHD